MTFRSLVLCYHAASDEWEHPLAVRLDQLRAQVRNLLRRGYRAVAMETVLEGRSRTFHVTFDDAFTSVRDALPVLGELGVPTTIFACSSYAADGRPLDVPELATEVAQQPQALATMTWDELRAHARDGITVGSHTVTHPHLRSLSDPDLAEELRESRLRSEDELGAPCRYLAYPYGESDARVWAAAEKAGYDAAFVLRGPVRPANRFAVPRVDLYRGDTLPRTVLKTAFSGRPLQRLSILRGAGR